MSIPEVDGRSLWEVVVRMETKLDLVLDKVADHEDRLRASASQHDLDRLVAKVDVLAMEQSHLKNQPYVTPKGLLTSMATGMTVLLGLFTLINQYIIK